MKQRTKKLVALLAAGCMVLSMLSGCGKTDSGSTGESSSAAGSETEAGEDDGQAEAAGEVVVNEAPVDESRPTTDNGGRMDKLVVAISADPQDLNPWNVNSGSKAWIYSYIYESLFDYDAENYYPVLAKGYEIVDDYHWDVEIYDYIHDDAGNPITAEDVVYSYQVQIDSGYAAKFDMFESIEVIDDYKVRFTWNKPIDGVCELEWPLCNIKIFSKKAYDEGNFASEPIGTGHYKVTSFVPGSSCVIEAYDDYWQTEELTELGHHANVQTIEYRVITESAQQVIALQNGTIDFSPSVPDENISDFMEGGAYADNYTVYLAPGSMGYFLIGNMSEGNIWTDKNFRLAVYYALNNEAIAKVANLQPCEAMCSAKWPYYEEWAKEENYCNTYDPEKAAEYLSQTSYNGESLVMLTANEEAFKNCATMIQTLLQSIGINTEITVMEDAAASASLSDPSAYDLYVGRSGGPTLIGAWNRVFNNADYADGVCIGLNSDPELPRLYGIANTAEGYGIENLTVLMNYAMDNAYCDIFAYPTNSYVYTNKMAKFVVNYVGDVSLSDCVYYLD